MSPIFEAIEAVQRVVDRLGTVEAARLSGVPYTTLHEARKRRFRGRSLDTLAQLCAFAEEYERAHPQAKPDEAA